MFSDLRFAARQLAKSPGFAAVIIATIGLAIGACTVVFSIVNTIILHPLDGDATDRVVMIRPKGYAGVGRTSAAASHFDEWATKANSFEAIYGFTAAFTTSATMGGEPFRLGTRWIKGDYLGVIGVQPAKGRGFLPEEFQAGRNKVVLIKHRIWQRAFPGIDDPIGRTLPINDEPHTIIGVLPPSKDADTYSASQIDAWVPFVLADPNLRPAELTAEARLKPGVTASTAQAEINRLAAEAPGQAARAAEEYVVLNKAEFIAAKSGRMLWSLLGAVGCVLLVACANIANLMLARATARQREIAVRAALGAARGRIARLLITESLLLALLGGGVGVLASIAALKVVRNAGMGTVQVVGEAGTGLYRLPYVELDWQVLGFALAATLLAGLLFGAAPALFGSRADLNEALKEGSRGSSEGRGRGRLRGTLVVTEVALAVVLLAGAGVFLRSFITVTAIDPGFVAEHTITFNYALPRSQYAVTESRTAFAQRLVDSLRELPGVQAVALGSLPLVHEPPFLRYEIEGRPLPESSRPATVVFGATQEYFKATGIPLMRGRTFTTQDMTTVPTTVVVNSTLAQRHFPNGDAVGARLVLTFRRPPNVVEIVGVVGDIRQNGPEKPISDQIYFPMVPSSFRHTVIVRGVTEPAALLATVRAQARSVEKDLVIADAAPLQAIVDGYLAQRRFTVQLLVLFSSLALIIATVGIYAVIAYSVTQRTNEIGIRMALGAQSGDVMRMILREGGRLVGIGLLVGFAAALAAGKLVEAMLFQTSARDPLALALVALVLGTAAALACWLPARRATRVDPIVALRSE